MAKFLITTLFNYLIKKKLEIILEIIRSNYIYLTIFFLTYTYLNDFNSFYKVIKFLVKIITSFYCLLILNNNLSL